MTLSPSNSEQTVQSAFDLLHPGIQEQLYRMEWEELRPVQVQAAFAILQEHQDVIITAPTAGGKTEAAFLPILSHILQTPHAGLRAMYIGPLKALINDQFGRLETLCKQVEIPVHRWHGDVSQSRKRKFIERPEGVLLITPESLEALLLNRVDKLRNICQELDFVVIDELHSFFGSERGAQLRSLMLRLTRYCSKRPRRIALSATLGDTKLAARWLELHEPESVRIISDTDTGRDIRLGLRAYAEPVQQPALNDPDSHDDEIPDERLINDLFQHFHGKKALVFGNQKARIELYADAVKQEAARRGVSDTFLVHHGSLGQLEREDAEAELRSDRHVTVFCSSTLELGIDIGPVEVVGQLGCPPSVNSLLQRLGRSGRREGQAAAIRLYYEVHERKDAPLPERLHLGLVQCCAISQLAATGWCEPPRPDQMHLSTLVHQVMALVAERGGARVPQLHSDLVTRGAFPGLSEPQFVLLLRNMGKHQLLEQDSSGLLILGQLGERIVRRFDFYSVFQTPVEFDVRHEERMIGSVTYSPSPDAPLFLILSGKRWQILSVDTESRVIHVVPSRGKRAPVFQSHARFEVHDRVVQQMRTIVTSDDPLSFCDAHALKYLGKARENVRKAELPTKQMITEGSKINWFTWRGTRVNRTLQLMLKNAGLECADSQAVLLTIDKCSPEQLLTTLSRVRSSFPSVETLAALHNVEPTEKYEQYLPVALRQYQFSVNELDLEGAAHVLNELAGIRT